MPTFSKIGDKARIRRKNEARQESEDGWSAFERARRAICELIGDGYLDRSMWPAIGRIERIIAYWKARATNAEAQIGGLHSLGAIATAPSPCSTAGMSTTIHRLKTWSSLFEDINAGRKTFDVRPNDRDFKIGDQVILCEVADASAEPMLKAREIAARIAYILPGGNFGIKDGYCVLGLSDIHRMKIARHAEPNMPDERDEAAELVRAAASEFADKIRFGDIAPPNPKSIVVRFADGQPEPWRKPETAPPDGSEFQAWCVRLDDYGRGWWEPRVRFNADGVFEIWGRIDVDMEGFEARPDIGFVAWAPNPGAPEFDIKPPAPINELETAGATPQCR